MTEELLTALQKHYAVVQALALDEDEMPEVKDETLPDEEGMARYLSVINFCLPFLLKQFFRCLKCFSCPTNCRPGIVKALEDFKFSVYGENYNEENDACGKVTEASRKRKAATENAKEKYSKYDWVELAESGQVC